MGLHLGGGGGGGFSLGGRARFREGKTSPRESEG